MLREFDIANIIKNHITNNKSILDIGCGTGRHLYPFIDLGFNFLHGVDIKNEDSNNLFKTFLKYKSNYANELTAEKEKEVLDGRDKVSLNHTQFYLKKFFPSLYKEFNTVRFDINKEFDFLNFDFNQKYDVILLITVLHFVNHELQLQYIQKAKSLLNESGLIVLICNKLDKCHKNQFTSKLEKIDTKIFKETGTTTPRTFYLLDNTDLRRLTNSFKEVIEFDNYKWSKLANQYICKI